VDPQPLRRTDDSRQDAAGLRKVIRDGGIHSVFQPIVHLDTGAVAGYEALARGPEGPLNSPLALFAAARQSGDLVELDGACRAAAFRGAHAGGIVAPLTVFVNVEPAALDTVPLEGLLSSAGGLPEGLQVVVEITERELAAHPAELLATVARVRELGWHVALDDVGAESASLAFMELLRPDVVKLDLNVVQQRPTRVVAEIMNAVNSYAERSGALILAEGIETAEHLATAQGLGAVLGQGWWFGRPALLPDLERPVQALRLGAVVPEPLPDGDASPFAALPSDVVVRRAPKRLLVELTRQLEREAVRLGESCVVATTFQGDSHFTAATAERYRRLVDSTGFVCALGEGFSEEPVPGLRGAALEPGDPVLQEWDVVVLSPHFSAALLARDLGDDGPDAERTFEFALTYRRDAVTRAAHGLLARVARRTVPQADGPGDPSVPGPRRPPERSGAGAGGDVGDAAVRRALEATSSGVVIVDVTRPGQPIVFANPAFTVLAGTEEQSVVGLNCNFLQGPDTDPAAVDRIRAAVRDGRESRETLLNYRGPDRVPWWNQLQLSPVANARGRVVQYVGVQTDVTSRVSAERAQSRESDLATTYLSRIEQLAYTDPLTGLMNRRRFEELVEAALLDAGVGERAVALLFMDLDGFKAVNDTLGHPAGDELLQETARRLRGRVRETDVLARFGGDEFLVALTSLDPEKAVAEAWSVAEQLEATVSHPIRVAGEWVMVRASVGVATYPRDAQDFGQLLHAADRRMYSLKHPRVRERP
jgi:diguanylate cyclase (GGDEF)-like protein/PAS domain S-box-containing protein